MMGRPPNSSSAFGAPPIRVLLPPAWMTPDTRNRYTWGALICPPIPDYRDGGPEMAPIPPTLGPPRRSRGGPRYPARFLTRRTLGAPRLRRGAPRDADRFLGRTTS